MVKEDLHDTFELVSYHVKFLLSMAREALRLDYTDGTTYDTYDVPYY